MFKMKKFFFVSMALLMSLLLSACGNSNDSGSGANGSGSDSSETFTFRVTSALPPTHGLWEGYYEPLFKQIEEDTDGRVKFEIYTSEELVEATKELEALQNGTVDIAAPLLPIYDPQRYPLSEISMLPLTHSSPEIGSKAFKKLVESDVELQDGKTFQELEYGEYGLKTFPAPISQEYSVSTTGQEFSSVDDLKKLQLRTPSRVHELFAQKVGIKTVTMPTFDLFEAMSRGSVDGSFLFISDWTAIGIENLMKYTVNMSLGHFSSLLAMTEETWNSIPEDIQEIMLQAMEDNFDGGWQVWNERSDEIINNAKENGAVFTNLEDLNPEVQEVLIKGMEETWFEFIELLEEQGEPGKEIAKLWRDIVLEEGGSVPDAIMELE